MNKRQTAVVENAALVGTTVLNINDYANIDSEITVSCYRGHEQTDTAKSLIDKRWECMACLQEDEKELKKSEWFFLALDASTNVTGWAVLNEYGQLVTKGTFTATAKVSIFERIAELLEEIDRLVAEHKIVAIVIEDIQLEYNTVVFKSLAMLRGILLYTLEHVKGMKVYSYGAEQWRSYCNIKGGSRQEKKQVTIDRAKLIYNQEFSEDEADATFLGVFAYGNIRNDITLDREGK